MAIVSYIRVSSQGQNLSRQREAMKGFEIDKVFEEKASAKNNQRPVLQEMLSWLREGDTLIIHSIDRISRSTKDLLEIVEILEEKGVQLISIKESIDTKTHVGKFFITIVGAIAEFEYSTIKERQMEGIEVAKKKGKFKGRAPIELDENFIKKYEEYKKRKIKTKKELAEILKISRPTLNKLIEKHEKV